MTRPARTNPVSEVPPVEPEAALSAHQGPTARDVARLAGVSPSTVSRVLNDAGAEMISPTTAQRVREAAARLGYRPNPLARALRGKHTQLIGLVVREIEDPFFSRFVAVLSRQARALGYEIVLGHAHSDASQALEVTAVLDTRRCDGVLLLGDLREDELLTREILKGNRAVVALCRGRSLGPVLTVNVDNRAGMRLLLGHLQTLGHRRLAFIHGGWLGDMRERQEAFLSHVKQAQLDCRPEFVQTDTNDMDGGYRALARLAQLPERPTAVLAADDMMAIGALKAASDHGLRVPRDISITGFDDIDMARFTLPALTTVRQPIEDMSRRALGWLVHIIGGATVSQREDDILPELIVRQSTGPAPAEAPSPAGPGRVD